MAQIIEDYCSFELSKLLKEKGFNASEIDAYFPFVYYSNGKMDFYDDDRPLFVCEAVTQAMAMKWLREVHNIDIIAPPQYDSIKWTYSAIIFKLSIPCTEIRLNDNKDKKEEAVEIAIKYCLENLI